MVNELVRFLGKAQFVAMRQAYRVIREGVFVRRRLAEMQERMGDERFPHVARLTVIRSVYE